MATTQASTKNEDPKEGRTENVHAGGAENQGVVRAGRGREAGVSGGARQGEGDEYAQGEKFS